LIDEVRIKIVKIVSGLTVRVAKAKLPLTAGCHLQKSPAAVAVTAVAAVAAVLLGAVVVLGASVMAPASLNAVPGSKARLYL